LGWVKIIELKKPSLKDVVLIQGLPGLGLVGKLAVDYFIEQLRPAKLAELYSDYLYLPDGKSGVIIDFNGVVNLPRYEFYYYKGNRDLVFLAGNTQPVTWAQYTVAEEVLNYLSKYGLAEVITLGGTVAKTAGKRVYAVADNAETMKWLEGFGVKPSTGGAVTGACGVMVGLAKLWGIKTYSLMGSVGEIYPDPEAAKAVLEVLSRILGLSIDFSALNKLIEDFKVKAEMAQKMREYAAVLEPRPGERGERERGPPGFYV